MCTVQSFSFECNNSKFKFYPDVTTCENYAHWLLLPTLTSDNNFLHIEKCLALLT